MSTQLGELIDPDQPRSDVIIISDKTNIRDAVTTMQKHLISSVLVSDDDDYIVGIITERDIVRKFTLVDMDDKLSKTVRTIMSMPVSFVHYQSYQEDIIRKHHDTNIRHFPISKVKDHPKKNDILGIVSVTDFFRLFFLNKKSRPSDQMPPQGQSEAPSLAGLTILSNKPERIHNQLKPLEQLGILLRFIENHEYFKANLEENHFPILFDVDSFSVDKLKELIPKIQAYKGPLLIGTQNLSLAKAYKIHLNPEIQKLLLMPIDISYCYWLLTHKWCKILNRARSSRS